jgi:two-component system, chemotaxis family, protein-glutamate methylesterase/glutaminase
MKSAPRKIRVLVVDDSALARRAISEALALDPEIEVVGTASDPYVARDEILALQPDVVTLDLEMPRMDGLTFLKILQKHHPLPVVIISSFTQSGSAKALEALEAGALDVLAKPASSANFGQLAQQLAYHVKAAAQSRRRKTAAAGPVTPVAPPIPPGEFSSRRVILIGASTGGIEALRFLLPSLPNGLPPILVVQHIPANFSRILANHLNEVCPFEVREAVDGEELQTGSCLVAPGDFHLALVAAGQRYKVKLSQSPPVHHCRPSVDILFRSAAEHAGDQAVAVLLTGMGVDGARGLRLLRAAGAYTLAENEESCVVFGMPQAAINLGAAERVVSLQRMPRAILQALQSCRK